MDEVEPADEAPHAPGPEASWHESWYADFTVGDVTHGGPFGAFVEVVLLPNVPRALFLAAVAGRDRPLVALLEYDAPMPRRDLLELRGPGLWVDIATDYPLEQFTVALEAFALTFDSPEDAVGDPRGVRTPFGLDLEWETIGEPAALRPVDAGYELTCEIRGEVLIGPEQMAIDAHGSRRHTWGAEWPSPYRAGATAAHAGDIIARVPFDAPIPGAGRCRLERTLQRNRSGVLEWVERLFDQPGGWAS